MPDSTTSLLEAGLHWLPALVLLWLAFHFGRTLRVGAMSLIEQIARRSNPEPSAALCRYARRLTVVWCAYFIIAAMLALVANIAYTRVNLTVWSGTVALFVGEHWLRGWLLPGEVFPGLLQQLRDTWGVWRTRD